MRAATDQVPVFAPLIEEEERAAVESALAQGWLGMGALSGRFEAAVADIAGVPAERVAVVATGHAALHLGLLLAGIGPGDEVITPSLNNVADLQAIRACGADVVFCDVSDDTLCIDVESAAELVSAKTSGLICTDYACHIAEHDAISKLAEAHSLRVVHDAAHSFGAAWEGRPVGSFSDITMFSFDPVKTVTCIDGGALVVGTQEERDLVHEMRLIGMGQPSPVMYENKRAFTYDVERIGFRYHLSNIHAAIGLAQVEKLDAIRGDRRSYFSRYEGALADVPWIRTPGPLAEGALPFMYYVRVPAPVRDAFRRHLRDRGIDSGIHWRPGHNFSFFSDCRRGDLQVTERAGGELVTLPFHSKMEEAVLERVVEAVLTFEGGSFEGKS